MQDLTILKKKTSLEVTAYNLIGNQVSSNWKKIKYEHP